MLRPGLWTAAFASGVILAMLAVAPAAAIVPPKNCKNMVVDGKRYKIKADQMRCAKARKYSRKYLRSHDEPRGFSCQDYGRETRIKFRCSREIKVFFAIRR